MQNWLIDTLQLHHELHSTREEPSKPEATALPELSYAATRGDLGQLRSLVIQQGVPVDQADFDQRTALHVAASEGLLDMVEMLVDELKADTSPVDRFGSTPLDDAARAGHDAVVRYLSANVNAAHGPRSSVVVRQNSFSTLNSTADASFALCNAAATGDLDTLRHLAKAEGLSIDKGDYDRRTA